MSALLEVRDIEVRYGGIRALNGLGLSVEQGEVVALLGANGAGKTTALRTISGLLRPTAGTVNFDGKKITGLRADQIVALGISHVPEGRRIFPQMSVFENLRMGAYQRRSGFQDDIAHVFELFPVLSERTKQKGGTLSGGEQQMLAIGRALMSRPRLLLLDEPSMGLAPIFVRRIFDIIRDIRARGTTVLVVEQNAAQALELADRGYVLEVGTVVMSDTADVLLRNDRVRSAYLGESVT